MEGMAMMGFIFGMIGIVAFVQLQHLKRTLKKKGILDPDNKEEKQE